MKKIFYILLLTIIGCAGKKDMSDRETFIREYKIKYFSACLKHSFNNSEINTILQLDGSGSSELTLGYAIIQIDSVSRNKLLLRNESKNTVVAEGSGSPFIENCLDDYNSSWLNEMANKAYIKRGSKRYGL